VWSSGAGRDGLTGTRQPRSIPRLTSTFFNELKGNSSTIFVGASTYHSMRVLGTLARPNEDVKIEKKPKEPAEPAPKPIAIDKTWSVYHLLFCT